MQSNYLGDQHFDIVLRGYDRAQVDERVRFLSDELATAEQALTAARERTAGLEEELSSVRSELDRRVPDPDVGFGDRVEKILRLAEEEAAEIRQRADGEASSIVERARAEAEQMAADADEAAKQRTRQSEQDLERLKSMREDVQRRLLGTKKVLDDYFSSPSHPDGDSSSKTDE